MRLFHILIVVAALVAGFLLALDQAPPSFDPKVLTSIIASVQGKKERKRRGEGGREGGKGKGRKRE